VRTVLVFFAAFVLGLLIQATVVHAIVPAAIAPDFIAMLVLFLALRYRHSWGVTGAFLLGAGSDFASARFLGPGAAGSVIGFLICAGIANHVYAERALLLALLGFLCSLAKNAAALLLVALYVRNEILTVNSGMTLLGEALITAVLTPLVVRLMERGNLPIEMPAPFRVPRPAKRTFS
jgi:rod shape-determining protein MreD